MPRSARRSPGSASAAVIWCATTPTPPRRCRRWSATWSAPASCRGRERAGRSWSAMPTACGSGFAETADADGQTDLYGLQALVARDHGRERRGAGPAPRSPARGRPAGAVAAAAARARSPGWDEDRRAARWRVRAAGCGVRPARATAGLLAVPGPSGRGGELRADAAGEPAGAGGPGAASLRAAAAGTGPRRAVVRAGHRQAARSRRVRRRRAGPKEDRGLLRRLRHRRRGWRHARRQLDRCRGKADRALRARDDRVSAVGQGRPLRHAGGERRLRRVHAGPAARHRRRRGADLRAADRRSQPGELLVDPRRADRVPPAHRGAAVAAAGPRPLPAGVAAVRGGGPGHRRAATR